jgi:hypothetical protein
MAVRTNRYNLNLQNNIAIDDGLSNYLLQTKYLHTSKVDYSEQSSIDLLPNVETTISIPNLANLKIIQWEALDPVAVSLKNDTQIIPAPIYNPPSMFGLLKFTDVVPLFVPDFIRIRSTVATSVTIVVVGTRI